MLLADVLCYYVLSFSVTDVVAWREKENGLSSLEWQTNRTEKYER